MPPTPNPNRTPSTAARAGAALAALLVVALSIAWWWIHHSIPALDGRLALAGLHAPVQAWFDAYAVPHVHAQSDADAWRTVGYLQARDRLWQMELYRRAASGRLSEILGEATLAIDQRFLTLGLRRAAEIEWQRTTPRVKTAFEQYAAGVNAVMRVSRGMLPVEHQLLGLEPEAWTPVDSLAIGKLFAWRLAENHRGELLRYELVGELGDRALELFPPMPEWAPTIITQTVSAGAVRRAGPTRRLADYPPGLEWLSPDSAAMSNSWVVHGSRTSSGRPLLANDPHLMIEMPSVWWEVHVTSDTLDVAGATIPGIPFVVIGHNARIAWGLTNVGADVQDFFRETLDSTRGQYRAGDAWLPLEVRRQDIRVRGRRDPVPFEVRSTRNGPVLNAENWRDFQSGDPPNSPSLDQKVLALKWDAVIGGQSAAAFDALARASGWSEFLTAVRHFAAPAQNFVYADVDGNIGYAMSGLLPVRSEGAGILPLAASRETEWRGSVDVSRLPAVLNPPSGQIVTANNEVDPSAGFHVTADWVAPFRAQRITARLDNSHGLDVDAMAAIQADITSLSADRILTHVELPPPVTELQGWDRKMDERPVTALYHAFERALWRRTFADEMSPDLFDRFYRYAGNERFAGLHAVIESARSPWFDDRTTAHVVETRADIARLAASDAVGLLQEVFGERSNWRWNEMHAVTFTHALAGGGRVLDWFFSRGPVPVRGGSATVNKTTVNLRRLFETSEAASYRQILVVGAWDDSVAVNTAGQSGHPQSPHYFDQNVLWREGRYRQLAFSDAAIRAAAVSHLELVP